MPEDKRGDFPSLEGITEYMVPGPGMSALEPWMDPPPESAVATGGSNGANGATQTTETKEGMEIEQPQEDEPVPDPADEDGAGGSTTGWTRWPRG